MNWSRYQLMKSILCGVLSLLLFDIHAQGNVDVTPIVVPEPTQYNWLSQDLPLWGAKIKFPDEPESKSKEIYTDKGIITQKSLIWNDYLDKLSLDASYNKLSEVINVKNEKKLIEPVAQRIAIIYGGYPILGAGIVNLQGIREYFLEVKTLKGSLLKARIFAQSDQVLVLSALIAPNDDEAAQKANYFLNQITFNPLPGEIVVESNNSSNNILSEAKWETLSIENFKISFPRLPITQHKTLNINGSYFPYYEWYMVNGLNQKTYMLTLTPIKSFNEKDLQQIIAKGIETTLNTTEGTLVQQKSMDYFKFPLEEIILKTELQSFRVRYFCDGQYLYQLLVSGKEGSLYEPDANRFLDGIRWSE